MESNHFHFATVLPKFCRRRSPKTHAVAFRVLTRCTNWRILHQIQMPGLKMPPLVHYIITVKLNGCLWNSAQWLWTQYHRMMIITHCHALCGGCTFAYFTQVWQSAKWHYRSKQGNLCNLISANKQPPWNQRSSITVSETSFSQICCCSFCILSHRTPSKCLTAFCLRQR